MKKWATLLLSLTAMLAMPLAHAEGTVARAVITTAVVDREPTNDLTNIPASEENVMFFTDLRGMEGQTILHRWMHGGEQVAEKSFNVGGQRWRVWSSKKMMSDWQGDFTVQVIDGAGEVLAEKTFTYGAGAGTETPMETEEAPAPEEEAPVDSEEMGESMPESDAGAAPAAEPAE